MRTFSTKMISSKFIASCLLLGTLHFQADAFLADVINNRDKIASGFNITKKLVRSSKNIPPHEEYQVGRNIAAQILSMTPALNDETLVHRVNLIGQSLAMKSSRPEIYSSYSFMILDSEDPNGFATPGGHIFITKGLLDLCEDDHHIAAILAHEVGHVSAQHGSKLIKKMRYTDAALSAATELAKHSSDDTASMLSERFGDITKEVFSKVVEKGFGRAQELEADGFGVLNLKAAGFRPSAMEEMLSKIDRTFGAMDIGLFKSHPKPQDRIAHVQKVLETGDPNGKATEASAEVSENKTEEPKKKKKKRFGLF